MTQFDRRTFITHPALAAGALAVTAPFTALRAQGPQGNAGGGTNTIEFDTKTGEVVRSWASISGTVCNCAGGPTPWDSGGSPGTIRTASTSCRRAAATSVRDRSSNTTSP